ncbi:hypothetical protein [Cupriavidus sp. H18C2]|uniref:hypothetical protein n=1 Tax=Cupriavidus sp. H18C2 TaxID=3241602 RepID=UPI003BF7769D
MDRSVTHAKKYVNVALIGAADVREAASHLMRRPAERSHSKNYGVNVGDEWFTPRDLLRAASSKLGIPISKAVVGQYDQAWRQRLAELGYPIQRRSVGSLRRVDAQSGIDPRESLPLARPDYILAEHIVAAAREWKQGKIRPSYRPSSRYNVWISVDLESPPEPFPPKAILGLASAHSGQRPLQPKDFTFTIGGNWHARLVALGFEVLLRGDQPGVFTSTARFAERKTLDGNATVALEDAMLLPWSDFLSGPLREALMERHMGRCQVSGIGIPEILCATPILRQSEDAPPRFLRVDEALLLAPNIAALFSAGHIAFSSSGQLWMSPQTEKLRGMLGLRRGMKLVVISCRQSDLLLKHYENALRLSAVRTENELEYGERFVPFPAPK